MSDTTAASSFKSRADAGSDIDGDIDGLLFSNRRYVPVTSDLRSICEDALRWRQFFPRDSSESDITYLKKLMRLCSDDFGLPCDGEYHYSWGVIPRNRPPASPSPISDCQISEGCSAVYDVLSPEDAEVLSDYTADDSYNISSSYGSNAGAASPEPHDWDLLDDLEGYEDRQSASLTAVDGRLSVPTSPGSLTSTLIEQASPALNAMEEDFGDTGMTGVRRSKRLQDVQTNLGVMALADGSHDNVDDRDYVPENAKNSQGRKRRKTRKGDKSLGVPLNPDDDPYHSGQGGDKRGCGPARLGVGKNAGDSSSLLEPNSVFRDFIYSLARVGDDSGRNAVWSLISSCASIEAVPKVDGISALELAVKDVIRLESKVSEATVSYLFACIQFTAIVCQDSRENSDIYRELLDRSEVQVGERQLYIWFGIGIRYGVMMQAGGVHILLVIVALGLRATLESMFPEDVSNLAYFIRTGNCGGDFMSSAIIVRTLIPSIHCLRRACFVEVIGANGLDMEVDDRTLNLKLNKSNLFNILLANRHSDWLMPVTVLPNAIRLNGNLFSLSSPQPKYDPTYVVTQLLDSCPPLSSRMEHSIYIDMKLDLSQPINAMQPDDLSPCSPGYKWALAEAWTEREREKVLRESTIRVSSIKELRDHTKTVTANGRRKDRYIYIPAGFNDSSDIIIRTQSSSGEAKISTMLFRNDYMSQQLKERLWHTVMLHTRQFENYNMASEDDQAHNSQETQRFKVVHLDFWARYLERAKTHGEELIYPALIEGNKTQRLPHPSADLRTISGEVEKLTRDLADVFDVIERKIRQYFPDVAVELERTIDALPGSQSMGAASFLGLVININARCRAHRDKGDLHFCIVIPFGDFQGGELVLFELGLVFELRCGDIFLFDSVSLTHFNMPFKGQRGSLVLHSDKSILNYMKEHNGWGSYLNNGNVSARE